MAYLPIRCAWTHFAPTFETLTLEYDPPDRGRLVSVRLEVRDEAGTLVYRSDPADCGGGPAPVTWTGALNQGNDANTEPFATPLRSPYKLKIDAVIEEDQELQLPEELLNAEPRARVRCPLAQERDAPVIAREQPVQPQPPKATEVTVKVLYHSIKVLRGPWLAAAQAPVRGSDASICDKLNQLGYHGGPPERPAANTDFLAKAKERFRRNHGDIRGTANPNAAAFEDALDAAIGDGTARPVLTTDQNDEVAPGAEMPTGGGAPLRVYIEAVGFDEDLAAQTDEFMQQVPPEKDDRDDLAHDFSVYANKTTSEARKLNRPLIPLEAVIYLKAHDNSRQEAPRAVGAVRVEWKAFEPGEDISVLPLNDRVHCGIRTYFHRLYESRYVHLEQDTNTNCPALYGGIRTAAANNYRNPFWREAQPYAPYAVPTDDNGRRALWVPAYTDWASHQARVGRSGIYFHPSLIAGDHYKLRATLSFAGLGNQVALEQANPDIKYDTKTIVVWRRVEIFAVVGWPSRDYGGLPAKCKARYAHAYHELDFGTTQFLRISQVINNADYAAWINHIQTNYMPALATLGALFDLAAVHDECPIVIQPDQVPTEEQVPKAYFFINNIFNELLNQPNVPSAGGFLLRLIATRLRTGHPAGGVIFLEYKLSDAVKDMLTNAGLEPPTTSNGNAELMGIIDQAVNANSDYVFTHELAHCFWLTHHENAQGSIGVHHDQYDHDCMMSYPDWDHKKPKYAHHTADSYDPMFCGKCNLKLRGWNITHRDILSLDTPRPPDDLTALFYYDRADPELHWDVELATVRTGFTAVSRGPFRERHFNRNADFDTWMAEVSDCDIYHHVTHGNVRCSSHKMRVGSMSMATPRYPTWCRDDKKAVARLEEEEQRICVDTNFNAGALTQFAKDKFITPSTFFHTLRSVVQWTVDDHDSSQDIEFTYEQIKRALRTPPRVLAFFSSCLVGWEKSFAKLFIDAGTPYVIAFRSRYESAQALEFSDVFYKKWRAHEFDPDGVMPAFSQAAHARPHAEPVLFTKAAVIRAFATSMAPDSGEFRTFKWSDDKGFYAPIFPNR